MAERQAKGSELRRTDRDEGLKLLYGAALDVARQKSQIPEGTTPSFEHSKLERGQYKIRSSSDRLITSVTLHEARSMLAYRREVARKILDRAKVFINSDNPGNQEKRLIRIQPLELRALDWAIGTGRRIPQPPDAPKEPWLSIGLLLCCLVPGVLHLLQGQRPQKDYHQNLADLVDSWRMAAKPDPPDSFFAIYHL